MTNNESLQLFLRLVSQKHKLLKKHGNNLMQALVSEDSKAKTNAAEVMLQAASNLKDILSDADIPNWLSDVISHLGRYISGGANSYALLSNLILLKPALEDHRWVFEESAETSFDFDSIFDRCKKESRLPELFDEIVRQLEEIHKSGAVDSITMLRALGKVISTIKRSKDGSYFSLNGAWEFLLSFLNNYLWGELSKLPVLGAALEALGKTIKETNDEMFLLHMQVKDEMTRVVEEEVKVLANKSAFPFVAYDKNGHLLQSPTIRQLPDATA